MSANEFSVAGMTIVITGGGRGLGRVMAASLARSGAKIMVAGRTVSDNEAVVASILAAGGDASAYQFDAQDSGQCEGLVLETVRQFGRLDGMVVNHGVTLHETAYETRAEDFRRVVDINLTSCFLCAQMAGRQMRTQPSGGSIVLISSNASFLAYDELLAYGASKGGVDQLCRQLGAEWAPDHIRVNAIGPGYMTSHMRGVEAGHEDPEFNRTIMGKIPMRRRGDAEELVGTVSYFLSGASSYVTGQYIAVDGGYSLT